MGRKGPVGRRDLSWVKYGNKGDVRRSKHLLIFYPKVGF